MDQEQLINLIMDQVVTDVNNVAALNEKAKSTDPILKQNEEEQYIPRQCLRVFDYIRTFRPIQVLKRGRDGLDPVEGYRFDAEFIRFALESIGTYTSEGLVLPPGLKDTLPIFFQPLMAGFFKDVEDYNAAIEKVQEHIQDQIERIKSKVRGELEERDRICQRRDVALRELGIFKYRILRILEKIAPVAPPQKFEPWPEMKP